jgi:hypothetical protein
MNLPLDLKSIVATVLRIHKRNTNSKLNFKFRYSNDENIPNSCGKIKDDLFIITLSEQARKEYGSYTLVFHELAHAYRTDFDFYNSSPKMKKINFSFANLFEDIRIEWQDMLEKIFIYPRICSDLTVYNDMNFDSDDNLKIEFLFNLRNDYTLNAESIPPSTFCSEAIELYKIATKGFDEIREYKTTPPTIDRGIQLLQDMKFKNIKSNNSKLDELLKELAKAMIIADGITASIEDMADSDIKALVDEIKTLSKNSEIGDYYEEEKTQEMQVYNGSITFDRPEIPKIIKEYKLSENNINKMKAAIKKINSKFSSSRISSQDPDKKFNIKNLIEKKFEDGIYIKTIEEKKNPKVSIICDYSGSMSGEPIDALKRIIYGFNILAKKKYLNGKVLITSSYHHEIFDFPLSDKDLEFVFNARASGDENMARNIPLMYKSISKSDKTFFITDGEYTETEELQYIKKLQRADKFIGLYVGHLNKQSGNKKILKILEKEIIAKNIDELFSRLINEL